MNSKWSSLSIKVKNIKLVRQVGSLFISILMCLYLIMAIPSTSYADTTYNSWSTPGVKSGNTVYYPGFSVTSNYWYQIALGYNSFSVNGGTNNYIISGGQYVCPITATVNLINPSYVYLVTVFNINPGANDANDSANITLTDANGFNQTINTWGHMISDSQGRNEYWAVTFTVDSYVSQFNLSVTDVQAGTGAWSNFAAIQIDQAGLPGLTATSPTQQLVAYTANNQVVLNWQPITSATSYNIIDNNKILTTIPSTTTYYSFIPYSPNQNQIYIEVVLPSGYSASNIISVDNISPSNSRDFTFLAPNSSQTGFISYIDGVFTKYLDNNSQNIILYPQNTIICQSAS